MKLALLGPNPHRDRACDDEPELLVLVMVFGQACAWVQVDDGHRHPLALDGAGGDSVAQRMRPDVAN